MLGTANGAANGGKRSLRYIKVTECGSPTGVGLIQCIVCPAFFAFSGTKTVNGAVAFPPPAPTRIVSLLVVCVRAGSCTCGSSIIVVVVVGMDKTSPPPADISQLK